MTYSIFAKGKLTKEHCRVADKAIESGLIETAYDDLITFHSLSITDIKPARKLMERFGFKLEPEIYEEHYDGALCDLVEVSWRIL